jgi:hypothetical protein
MAIDFTKPIRNISEPTRDVKILFHDEHSVFVEICSDILPKIQCRFIYPLEKFNVYFENILEEPRKIKGVIGILKDTVDYQGLILRKVTPIFWDKEHLLENFAKVELLSIVEINVSEGEGL